MIRSLTHNATRRRPGQEAAARRTPICPDGRHRHNRIQRRLLCHYTFPNGPAHNHVRDLPLAARVSFSHYTKTNARCGSVNRPFPLTPSLSPGERGNLRPRIGRMRRFGGCPPFRGKRERTSAEDMQRSLATCVGCSLSPGERAGVRGNGATGLQPTQRTFSAGARVCIQISNTCSRSESHFTHL